MNRCVLLVWRFPRCASIQMLQLGCLPRSKASSAVLGQISCKQTERKVSLTPGECPFSDNSAQLRSSSNHTHNGTTTQTTTHNQPASKLSQLKPLSC